MTSHLRLFVEQIKTITWRTITIDWKQPSIVVKSFLIVLRSDMYMRERFILQGKVATLIS